jgi:hypothetical protein
MKLRREICIRHIFSHPLFGLIAKDVAGSREAFSNPTFFEARYAEAALVELEFSQVGHGVHCRTAVHSAPRMGAVLCFT